MLNSRDRLLEEGLASLIDAASTGVQCVPNLLAGGETTAILPRVVVLCESQETPDFQHTPDGIYGLHTINVLISSMVEASSATSSTQMQEMNRAVDNIVIYNGGLAAALTAGALKVYGVIPEGCRQERTGNQLIRHRALVVLARLEQSTSMGLTTEDGQQILTEDSLPIYTE